MPHPSLGHLDHRPYPLPSRPWISAQSWIDLLFAHWPVPAAELEPLLPDGIELDTFDGRAWLGVVPFFMRLRARGGPVLPHLGAFAEINVRTYVRVDDRPGVWFFSLDAERRLAVWAARRFFHLPYFNAAMAYARDGDEVRYESHRRRPERDGAASFRARYGPCGAVAPARPGTLEHFLTERYCLYATNRAGRRYRGDIHHEPWPLQPAAATIEQNTMAGPVGFDVSGTPPVLHFARRIEVAIWALQPLDGR